MVEDVEEEVVEVVGEEVDHWVNVAALVTVQTGPQFAASGGTAKLQINQMEIQMLGNAGLVQTVPLGHQFAPGLDIVNWEEVELEEVLEEVLEVVEECLVVGNVGGEDQDPSQGLKEADPQVLVEGDAREKVLGIEPPGLILGGNKAMVSQVAGML